MGGQARGTGGPLWGLGDVNSAAPPYYSLQAWYNAAASESKYTSSSTAASASEASFKLMSEKYENGKANAVEYNEAKQNLMKAQSDELQAKYEYLFRTKILDFYKGEPIE